MSLRKNLSEVFTQAAESLGYLVAYHRGHKALKRDIKQAEKDMQSFKEQQDFQGLRELETRLEKLKERVARFGGHPKP